VARRFLHASGNPTDRLVPAAGAVRIGSSCLGATHALKMLERAGMVNPLSIGANDAGCSKNFNMM
jgi:hypothetical protein